MKTWESMTNEERTVAVLTERCGWVIEECDFPASCYGNNCTGGYDAGSQGCFPYGSFPPILTSADAALEHVASAIKAKGYYYRWFSEENIILILRDGDYGPVHIVEVRGVGKSDLERFAAALCEAAWKMGAKGRRGRVSEEHCVRCDALTGRAGRGEDSLYIDTPNLEIGPLCEECFYAIENDVDILIEMEGEEG